MFSTEIYRFHVQTTFWIVMKRMKMLIMITRWKKEYMATSHKVILAETLSPTFVGFTFQVRTIKMAVTNQTNLAIL